MPYADATLIALRESLEALLIVGVFAGLAVKLGQPQARRYLYAGAIAAGLASIGLAVAIDRLAREAFERSASAELFEGVASLLAVAILTYMVVWMRGHTHALVAGLEGGARDAVLRGRPVVLFSIAFVAVAREGLETALFYGAIAPGRSLAGLGLSALLGLAASAVIAGLLFLGVIRLSIRRFFAVTGLLVVLLAGGLLATGVHELAEVGVLPETPIAWSTASILSQDSTAGSLAKAVFGYRHEPTLLELAAYVAYVSALGIWFARGIRALPAGAGALVSAAPPGRTG